MLTAFAFGGIWGVAEWRAAFFGWVSRKVSDIFVTGAMSGGRGAILFQGDKCESPAPSQARKSDPELSWRVGFYLIEMLLKGLVACRSILAVVDFAMASWAYRAYPSGMVRPAVCHAPRMVGFQVRGAVLPTEGSFLPARFATSARPLQDIDLHSGAPLKETTSSVLRRP